VKTTPQEFDSTEVGVLVAHLAPCCGIERAAMMAHTVLMHDLAMGRLRLDHLTGALKLADQASILFGKLRVVLQDAIVKAASLPAKSGK